MNSSKRPRRRTLADELQKLLDLKVGERAGLAPFAKQFPQVVSAALTPNEGGLVRGVSEFRFGSELRADFVLLTAFSGGFIIKFVEFEPSTETILKPDGSMTRRFNHAYNQVLSWQEFVRHRAKGSSFGLELERQFREQEILVPRLRGENPFDNTGRYPLSHPHCELWVECAIVIGRRNDLTHPENARKGSLASQQITVVSWDRLVDAARAFLPNGKPFPTRYTPPTLAVEKELNAFRELMRKASEGIVK
jgi:hypothetical protein